MVFQKSITLWDFLVHEDMKLSICEPVYSSEEIKAIWHFDAIWNSIDIEPFGDRFDFNSYKKHPKLKELIQAAQECLEILEKRGRMPEDKEIF